MSHTFRIHSANERKWRSARNSKLNRAFFLTSRRHERCLSASMNVLQSQSIKTAAPLAVQYGMLQYSRRGKYRQAPLFRSGTITGPDQGPETPVELNLSCWDTWTSLSVPSTAPWLFFLVPPSRCGNSKRRRSDGVAHVSILQRDNSRKHS
jgi:hypothetical protein